MALRQTLSDWFSRHFGRWRVDDPRPIAAEAPYSYYLPPPEWIEAVAPGDSVQAVFRPWPADRHYGAERMWVAVTATGPDWLEGTLDNAPFDIPQLQHGAAIRLPRSHIIAVIWADGKEPPETAQRRWHWERCMVDDCVVEGRSRVDYLYREEPDLTREGDKDPDSGWRIRGTGDAIADDEANGREPQYIALCKVLNVDDRWIDLIDEPPGEAFQWWEDEQRFIRCDKDAAESWTEGAPTNP